MSADIDKERAEFEQAMNAARFFPAELNFARTESPSGRDEYANSHLQSCWLGWQARAAIPPAPAERQRSPYVLGVKAPQQRAPDQAAHDIGMAHIICDQAGIPQGEIIGRLVALSGKADRAADQAADSARLDWLEARGNESDGLLLHAGNQNTGGRSGLGLIQTGRTLRQAVDSARGVKATAPVPRVGGKTKPCGGCGEHKPERRCLGCLHDFGADTSEGGAKSEPFHRETGMCCTVCCARKGEPHKPGCTNT